MEKIYRTFIAVKIRPAAELLDLYEISRKSPAGEAVKWVDKNNLHLTLRFLGDTTETQVAEIKTVLEEVCADFDTFSFSLKGLGYFKSNRMPRVLFAGIQNFEELGFLAANLENVLQSPGFEKEQRPFAPHLTLARIKFLKNKKLFYSCIEKYAGVELQTVTVSEIIFYQSILTPSGPEYIPLKIFTLKG